ncbi:MAG: threonine/serine dehydratase [Pseudomonadota bacterium]
MSAEKPPTLADARAAVARLAGLAVRTPLITNDRLDELTGGRIFLKCENLQRTGSFKFRGGYNAVCANSDAARERGVIASSSGNHAQGVAEACRMFGARATIVMPSDAPQSKMDRTRRSGADIVTFDRANDDRDALLDQLARESGALKIHPFDNCFVIAGQATVGLEAVAQLQAAGVVPDAAVICAGGGGLIAGMHLAVSDVFPDCVFHTAEPEGHDDQARSHAAGTRVQGSNPQPSLQDAIITPMPGEISFSMLLGKLGPGLTATDDEALRAVAFAYHELKMVVEPGGACALATILSGAIDLRGKTAIATLSGGNIDPSMMARALELGTS